MITELLVNFLIDCLQLTPKVELQLLVNRGLHSIFILGEDKESIKDLLV